MFGCRAAYYGGLLVLVCANQEEPWNGVLLPTEREHHASLMREFPRLSPHPILGKWLYLSQEDPGFEEIASTLVKRIMKSDIRIGVVPGAGKRKRSRPTVHRPSSSGRSR